jgi:tetratricopeptide (TPR) repeat protein
VGLLSHIFKLGIFMDPLEHIIQFLQKVDEIETTKTLLNTLTKYSQSVEQTDQLARLLNDIKDYPNAIKQAEKTLVLCSDPQQLYAARANLAKLYNHINEPLKALRYIDANLYINPHDYEALMERVFSFYLYADFEQSKQLTLDLLNDPNTPSNIRERCKFNYGSYLLEEDKFQEGLKHFIETGHGELQIWKSVDFPGPTWLGDVVPNKNIAIIAEGGIGDEIINIRFMNHIKQLGMNPIFITNRQELVQFFNRNGFKTVSGMYSVPEDSEYCLAMFLPILLNITPDQLYTGPYLTPDAVYVEKWKQLLPSGEKVAIRWQGSKAYEQNLHRSLQLSELDKVLDFSRTDITFVSVQKDDYEGIENYPMIFDARPYLDTLEDLLACLSLMNDTVSSCTSVAHVCAAGGFPITVCPPIATYYVWLGTAKWYGENCRINRNMKWNDWSYLNNISLLV